MNFSDELRMRKLDDHYESFHLRFVLLVPMQDIKSYKSE